MVARRNSAELGELVAHCRLQIINLLLRNLRLPLFFGDVDHTCEVICRLIVDFGYTVVDRFVAKLIDQERVRASIEKGLHHLRVPSLACKHQCSHIGVSRLVGVKELCHVVCLDQVFHKLCAVWLVRLDQVV